MSRARPSDTDAAVASGVVVAAAMFLYLLEKMEGIKIDANREATCSVSNVGFVEEGAAQRERK